MTATDWDTAADTFDQEPDHGLRDPAVRAAWAARMSAWLPAAPGRVLDLGCGTGSLALLAAERGHRVVGIDRSPRMARLARAKLAGSGAAVVVGDAGRPPVGERRFDVVLARHVLWLLPEPEETVRRWSGLLRPGGRLVLVEGVWNGTGLPADRVVAAARGLGAGVRHEALSSDAGLWGRAVEDERYAVIAGDVAVAGGASAGRGPDTGRDAFGDHAGELRRDGGDMARRAGA